MSDVTRRQISDRAMITVRGEFDKAPVRNAVMKATGASHPEKLKLSFADKTTVAWMSPDEILVLTPAEAGKDMVEALTKALAKHHALVQDVSDMRVIYRLEGPGARNVVARLTPADMSPRAFGPGDFRRTRLAQIAAGIWMRDDAAIGVMCFRALSAYAEEALQNAVASEIRG